MTKPLSHIAVFDRCVLGLYLWMEGLTNISGLLYWLWLPGWCYSCGYGYYYSCFHMSLSTLHRFPKQLCPIAAGALVGFTGTPTQMSCDLSYGRGKWKAGDSDQNTTYFPTAVSGEQPISSMILVFLYPALCYFHQLPTKYLSRCVHLNGVHLSYLEPLESILPLSHNIKPNPENITFTAWSSELVMFDFWMWCSEM